MKHYRAVVSEALESKSEDFVGLRHRAKALQDSMKHYRVVVSSLSLTTFVFRKDTNWIEELFNLCRYPLLPDIYP